MSNTNTINAARDAVQSMRQDKNSNGSYRYSVTYQDGRTEVVRWRASGDYSHALVFGDGRISFRSSPCPSTGGAICFQIVKLPGAIPTDKIVRQFESAGVVATVNNVSEVEQIDEYVAQNGEIEDLSLGINIGENILLTGPTGCGKTHLVQWTAHKMGRNLITIQGGDGMTPEHMIGYRDVIKDGEASITAFREGLLTMAMSGGSLLYVDEPNALPDGIRFYLFSAMDHRREVTLAEDMGRKVKAKLGFTVIASMNEGAGYTGTSLLNFAFRGRFDSVINLAYLPQDREAKLLHDRSGADLEVCNKLAEIAANLRASKEKKQLKTPIGTRTMLACARRIAKGNTPFHAAMLTIMGQVPCDLANERKAISDVLAANFRN